MNGPQAQGTVVTVMAISGVLLIVRSAKEGHTPSARQVIGIAAAGVGLSAAAQFAPNIAGPFALLWLTGEIFVYGGPAFTAISTAVAARPAAGSKPRTIST